MKKLRTFGLHAGILVLVAVVTAGARLALRDRHALEFKQLGQAATNERAREVEKYWKALPYADASEPGFLDKFLAAANSPALELSAAQQAKLQSRLRQVMNYLMRPSCEDYFRLRTDGLHYQFKPTQAMHALWTNGLHRSAAEFPSQPREAVGAWWGFTTGPSNRLEQSGVAAACLTNVAAAISRSNTPGALLNGRVKKGFTAAVEAANLGFEYRGADATPRPGTDAPLYVT